MKKSILMLTAMVTMLMIGCKEDPYVDAPGDNSHNVDTVPAVAKPKPTPDPAGADVPAGCLDVYQAREICQKLGAGGTTDEKYYVKGWIHKLDGKNADGINQYGNATFYISATNDGTTDNTDFEAFQVMGKDGAKLTSVDQVAVGDFVVIYGQLTNYNDKTYETVGKGSAYIYYSNNPNFGQGGGGGGTVDPTKITPDPAGADVPKGCLTVYEAREKCAALASGGVTDEEYYVKGWVHKLDSKNADGIKNYGNATFYISATNDGTTNSADFEAFQVYGKNKAKLTSVDQVAVGDFVVIRGKLTNYNGKVYETVGKGQAYIYYSNNPKF